MNVRPHLDVVTVKDPQRVSEGPRSHAGRWRSGSRTDGSAVVVVLQQAQLQLLDKGKGQISHADVELDVVGDDPHVAHVVSDLDEASAAFGSVGIHGCLVDGRP